MLGAASALYTRVGLQRDDLGDVLPGGKAKVFDGLIRRQRRDLREAVALQEDGNWREHEVKVLGVWDERKEDEQRQRVSPP